MQGQALTESRPETVDVLIVEDMVELAEMYAMALSARGFEIAKAHTAAEAWAVIATSAPRLILLDINLGTDNGLEILEELARRGGGGPEMPVLIFTNSRRADYEERAQAAGAAAYLVKANVRLPELVQTIKAKLNDQAVEG